MKNKTNILSIINKKNRILKILFFVIATFIVALNYNLILTPNKFVGGGMSGLAIIVNELTGLSRVTFLNLATVVLFILSITLLDKKVAFKSLFGSLTFNFMVSITTPLIKVITINFESTFLLLLSSAVLMGVGTGIIYRSTYNTGGSDVIITILNKYLKITMGKASTIVNIIIIGSGFLIFGPTNTLYAAFILLISNYITDRILLGIKDSKMVYIKSDKASDISNYLMKKFSVGVTEMTSRGGFFSKKAPILLVIVPARKYYPFRHIITNIDNKAFVLTIDCYGATGGYKKSLLPF